MRVDIDAIKRRFKIIGNNPDLLRAVEVAYQVANTDLAVLVTGESGSETWALCSSKLCCYP